MKRKKIDKNSESYIQFKNYAARNPMSKKEKHALLEWVTSGHSVYESPGSRYLCDPDPQVDFLTTYRLDESLEKEMTGMSVDEKGEYLKKYMGYVDETATHENEPSPGIPASRELFHLWEFVYKSGLGPQAEAYIDEHKDEEIPFE